MANIEKPKNKETVLGFLEAAEAWQLQSSQFPSKVGGKPAWLSQTNLPSLPDSACDKCQLPSAFLLQVYAPITEQERSFHRTLFVFCCKTPGCFSQNDSRCLKVYRSQLPRKNDFYRFDPPTDEAPCGTEPDPCMLGSGVKLCRLCGFPGQKGCSRCHAVSYCSKEHQTIDWRHSHKKECAGQALSSAVPSPFLFPEFELVTEPEELPEEEDLETEGLQSDVDCSTLADCKITSDMLSSLLFPFLNQDLQEGGYISVVTQPMYKWLNTNVQGFFSTALESELEEMAMHETQDTKVFQKFKQQIKTEPHQVLAMFRGTNISENLQNVLHDVMVFQVLRYCRGGSPLWLSSEHVPSENDVPHCFCGSRRVFEFQVMPQLLNHLKVDSPEASIDWGTLAVYTCETSCDLGNKYSPEFLWKQDLTEDKQAKSN